jgi:hypothetical protein
MQAVLDMRRSVPFRQTQGAFGREEWSEEGSIYKWG